MDEVKIENEGIVLDIDETLSDTIGYLILGLQDNFGNPEGLSVKEIVEKYKYTWNVPYWQSEDAENWVREACQSPEVVVNLPVIDDAVSFVNKIHDVVPIVGYVTARPECVSVATKEWLAKHGFPDAPVVCRPSNVPKVKLNDWKAGILRGLHPKVKGIVDDNPGLADPLGDYAGHFFIYNADSIDEGVRGVPCSNWERVYDEIVERFG